MDTACVCVCEAFSSFYFFQALFMSNRRKIEQQTNLLNAEWSALRIQSIPLSTSNGALVGKRVWSFFVTWLNFVTLIFKNCRNFFSAAGAPTYFSGWGGVSPRKQIYLIALSWQSLPNCLTDVHCRVWLPGFQSPSCCYETAVNSSRNPLHVLMVTSTA